MAIKINPAHKGLLHEDLGVKAGEPIPVGKLMQTLHSKDPDLRKRANFARNARKWNHK